MRPCTVCGCETGAPLTGLDLCAGCLLRLALETSSDATVPVEPELLAPVGRGPNGVVYLASDHDCPGMLITVKIIERAVAAATFVDAMRQTIARLYRHESRTRPGRILRAGTLRDGRPFVEAVYAPGQPLDRFLHVDQTARSSIWALGQLCEAVAEVHRVGAVHGSLKPENIILAKGGRQRAVALLDTGVRAAITLSMPEPEGVPRLDLDHDLRELHDIVCGTLSLYRDTAECGDLLAAMRARRPASSIDMARELSAVGTALESHGERR